MSQETAHLYYEHDKKMWIAVVNNKEYGVYDPYNIYATDDNIYDTFTVNVQMYDDLDAVKILG